VKTDYDRSADSYADAHLTRADKSPRRIRSISKRGGGRWGWRGWGGGGWGEATTTTTNQPVGNLIIDMFSGGSNGLVWRGASEESPTQNSDNPQRSSTATSTEC
jgi:hypothetical protein